MSLPNVAYPNPHNVPTDWSTEKAEDWAALRDEVNANPNFEPLTIKAAYVFGNVYGLCECVCHLVASDPIAYLASYGLFAAGVEIIGRCLNGNTSHLGQDDLETGLKCLHDPERWSSVSSSVRFRDVPCTIDELVFLRHFAAHGQATVRGDRTRVLNVDFTLLERMPDKLGSAIEWYWSALQTLNPIGEKLCEQLAKANIQAFRGFPIRKILEEFADQKSGGHRAISAIFHQFNWTV